MEEQTLATELLHEIKMSARRWFIIAVAELILILGLAGALVYYMSTPVEEIQMNNKEGNANYIGDDLEGDLINNGIDSCD